MFWTGVAKGVVEKCAEVLGKSAVEDRWGEGLQSYHRFDPTKVPLNQKAYDFWAKQGFTCDAVLAATLDAPKKMVPSRGAGPNLKGCGVWKF